jgi:DNA helicase-2/ATP-dependent DNA helicase PcrA
MNLLESLNSSQKEAVTTTEGPVLVIAGAGSGKTKTLTHRVVYLIQEKNIAPQNILAVTFTNKASMEMKERITKLLKESSGGLSGFPHIGTFHNICAKILRKEIDRLGYEKTFNIFDDQDQLALVKRIFKAFQFIYFLKIIFRLI